MAEERRSYDLDGYLNLRKRDENQANRKLSSDDFAVLMELKNASHEINSLITELIVIRRILELIGDSKLYSIICNLNRVIFSLTKQRDKEVVVKHTYSTVPPLPYEVGYVKKFIKDIRKRVAFIRNVIVPENLELTPIKEYLEVTGKNTLLQDIREKIGDHKAMFCATREQLDAYAGDILKAITEAGLMDSYKERLDAYHKRDEERTRMVKEEKQREATAEKHEMAEQCMEQYQYLFNRAMRTFRPCEEIGIKVGSVAAKLDVHGRNSWMVVRCDICNRGPRFRYYTSRKTWEKLFGSGAVYKNEKEAEEIAEKYRQQNPDKVYDVVKLSYAGELEDTKGA